MTHDEALALLRATPPNGWHAALLGAGLTAAEADHLLDALYEQGRLGVRYEAAPVEGDRNRVVSVDFVVDEPLPDDAEAMLRELVEALPDLRRWGRTPWSHHGKRARRWLRERGHGTGGGG